MVKECSGEDVYKDPENSEGKQAIECIVDSLKE